MNPSTLTQDISPRGRLSSDDYNLTIRQQPERAKVAGQKEKDRKPIDPPPIIQLQIRDLSDPAQNYLQSPYYFMCCNLCEAGLEQRGTLTSQSTLAGTLVSSLHRLKDIDNSDGGFFVFGDVSVKVEGDFRLRFSLFEMLREKAEVVYIKSIISDPFKVFTPRTFPGMAESTFLSRSFGDQGVRLRIRKEPRTLLKRAAPASLRSEDFPRTYPHPPILENRAISQPQVKQNLDYGNSASRGFSSPHNESSSKRQRTSADMTNRGYFDQDQRYGERPFEENRSTYATSERPPEDHRSTYPPNRNQLPHPVIPPQTITPIHRAMPFFDQTVYQQEPRYIERGYDKTQNAYGLQNPSTQPPTPLRLPSLNS